MFAKLYDTKECGQILVKIDTSDVGAPEVRYFFEPENLGVCSIAITFNGDDDKQWDNAERTFEAVDEVKAIEVVKKTLESIDV